MLWFKTITILLQLSILWAGIQTGLSLLALLPVCWLGPFTWPYLAYGLAGLEGQDFIHTLDHGASLSMGLGLCSMVVTEQPELLMTARFQEGTFPTVKAAYRKLRPSEVSASEVTQCHFRHVLLVKTGHRATPHSRGRLSGWGSIPGYLVH